MAAIRGVVDRTADPDLRRVCKQRARRILSHFRVSEAKLSIKDKVEALNVRRDEFVEEHRTSSNRLVRLRNSYRCGAFLLSVCQLGARVAGLDSVLEGAKIFSS